MALPLSSSTELKGLVLRNVKKGHHKCHLANIVVSNCVTDSWRGVEAALQIAHAVSAPYRQ
jgi:hypothetical protein